MTPAQIKRAKELYIAGKSTKEIAEKLGVSCSEAVRYWFRKNNVALRIPGHRRGVKNEPNADTEAIKKLRKEGRTFRDIGERFGLTPKAVQARLAYHGIN